MAVERRQLLMGGAAVIVLVLAVMWLQPASAPPPRPAAPAAQTPPPQPRAKSGGRNGAADPSAPFAPVNLKALSEARNEPGEPKRNPFRFQPKAVPKPVVTAPPVVIAPPVVSETPRPVGPPPLPPIALKFIGVLERANGVKWAVLTDGKTPTPFYGKEGDI